MVETVHVLIGMMAVAWFAAATILAFLWREVKAMSEVVEEQRTLMELRMMRMRYRRLGPDVAPVILEQSDAEGDGEGEVVRGERERGRDGGDTGHRGVGNGHRD